MRVEGNVWSRRKESSSVQSGGNREPALVIVDLLFGGSEQSKYIHVLVSNRCRVQTFQRFRPSFLTCRGRVGYEEVGAGQEPPAAVSAAQPLQRRHGRLEVAAVGLGDHVHRT